MHTAEHNATNLKQFSLMEQKQLYNCLRAVFKLAIRSIIVGRKEKCGLEADNMGNWGQYGKLA